MSSNKHESSPVDLDYLFDAAGGTESDVRELVELYLRVTAEQLESLSDLIKRGDVNATKRVAHTLIGSSVTCGMTAIVQLLRKLEQISSMSDLVEAEKLLAQINREFERTQAFLGEYIHNPSRA